MIVKRSALISDQPLANTARGPQLRSATSNNAKKKEKKSHGDGDDVDHWRYELAHGQVTPGAEVVE